MSKILCEQENLKQTDLKSFKSQLSERCKAVPKIKLWIKVLNALSDIEDFINMNTKYISEDGLSRLLKAKKEMEIELINCPNVIWVTEHTRYKIKAFIEDMEEIIKDL